LDDPPGVLGGVVFQLKDKTSLVVYIGKIKHVAKFNKERNWIWGDIGKKKISGIDLLAPKEL